VASVTIHNVFKTYLGPRGEAIPALRDVNLTVEDKELLVLVGPSGSGKTTLLRLVAGLEETTAGTVSLDGRVLNGVPPGERDIGMVFQGHALYPHLTVFENLALGLRLRGVGRAEIERRVSDVAEMLGLRPFLRRKPSALSGGERQRAALGRALVRRPKVFLLDEPLSNLDGPLRTQMRTEIARLQARLGATMIYVTHDQAEAMTLGRRIAVLKDGVIQQVAAPLALYRTPANLFVAGFLGSPPMNFFCGFLISEGGRSRFIAGSRLTSGSEFALDLPLAPPPGLANRVGQEVVLGLRAEHVRAWSGADNAENCFAATVDWVESVGAEAIVHLTAAGQEFTARIPVDRLPGADGRTPVRFEMGAACFFEPQTGLAIAATV
jgi:multiple sugar transport system ATP-binding protein